MSWVVLSASGREWKVAIAIAMEGEVEDGGVEGVVAAVATEIELAAFVSEGA